MTALQKGEAYIERRERTISSDGKASKLCEKQAGIEQEGHVGKHQKI
jgi:hypothetical protein